MERMMVTGESNLKVPAVMTARELRDLLNLSENAMYERLAPGGDLNHLVIAVGGRSVRISGSRVLTMLDGAAKAPTN